ncbi:MAG: hypothetical protein PHP73_05640 [Candidatus Omnitrophica bacterium]|nr:hypothetical protein [Candidatus Omnitrophota bacterium]
MSVFLRCTLIIFLSIFSWAPSVYCAQTSGCSGIEESKSKYLAANRYNEFVEFLDNFKDKDKVDPLCLNYYKAQTRYLQLEYLEEKQSWDDYFANGNNYRQQLEQNAQKVVDQADAANPLRPKARLLLWQFHYGQQDAFVQASLDDLVSDLGAYAKIKSDPELIKNVADALLAVEEKTKARQIYKLYVDQLVAGTMTDAKLKSQAAGFYKEGNLELAQAVYNIYIERISKTPAPEKLIQELFEIASLFVYKQTGFYDMAYAEDIYAKIEKLGGKDAFNQAAIYLRAFNLEKLKDYKGAQKLYLQLIQLYPDTKYFDEAVYKIAMIEAYALANINEARKYFEILAAKTVFSPQVISSLYQLGLLAQWEGNLVKAQEYYGLLLKNSADNHVSTAALVKDRLKEIEENKQLDYNLKTFLDLSLKNENTLVEPGKAELRSSGYLLDKNQKAVISSLVAMPQSGCNQVDLQYLWSGDLGGENPAVTDGSFQCAYSDAGTKTINIVIISPAGAIDRFFIMVDVY